MKGVLKKLARLKDRVIKRAEKHPLSSFLFLLFILFALIVAGNMVHRPKEEQPKAAPVKKVSTYHIGTAPRLTLQGQVEKAGVIQITALAGGVIQNIYATEGTTVRRGQLLVGLASNYQGGNVLSLSRQIAEKQRDNVENTYQDQKDLLQKQRDLANSTESNFEKMRDITNQSIGDTQSLIDLNNSIISSLNDLITASPSAAGSLNPQKSQLLSANLQLNNALRSAQYQASSDNPPTQIATKQRDIMLKQLDIQEKALDLNREVSNLQLQIARVNEAAMFPAAPFDASVQKVNVRVGQNVTPGTVLLTISAVTDPPLSVYVYTSKEISSKVSPIETSVIHIADKTLRLSPSFISTDAVQNNLYAIMYTLPQESYPDVTDRSYVRVEVPIGFADSVASVPFIPLDAIYQTQETSTVFVEDNGRAKAKAISLGPVYGNFVQVDKGLTAGDSIILDRNIIEGDRVAEN